MALLRTITLPANTDLSFRYTDFVSCFKSTSENFENAYIKIDIVSGTKDSCLIDVGIYDKKDGIRILSEQYNFVPSVDDTASNFIKQGYEYLKALPEYADSVDC